MRTQARNRGFSLVEMVVALGIFTIVAVAMSWLLVRSLRSNAVIWEQLQTQSDGRTAVKEVVDTVRRAEQSSVGSYPISTSTDYELTVYANIDSDTLREKVRFFVDTAANTFNRGVIKPAGIPLVYTTSSESIVILARSVVNDDKGVPAFQYFDQSYTGTSTPMVQPVTTTAIHVIRVQLELEKDPTQTPVPLHVESTVHLRNLKTN